MSESKIMCRFFTICDWEEEQRYLRQQHAAGWKFVRFITPCLYQFERCAPQEVVYQLDYNPAAENKPDYLQMFRDCGWEHVQDVGGYSCFRKPVSAMQNGEEEIFCDDGSRLDMLRRVFRGRVVFLLLLFLLGLLQLLTRRPIRLGWDAAVCLLLGALLVLYAVLLIRFGIKYRVCRRAMRQ